jgi:hypothetical protein
MSFYPSKKIHSPRKIFSPNGSHNLQTQYTRVKCGSVRVQIQHKCEHKLNKQAVLIGLAGGNRRTYSSPPRPPVINAITGEYIQKGTTVKQI